jgi:VWFA-related protein
MPQLRLVLWIAGALALHGCPHHIEEMVEKMRPPQHHKPKYMTSAVPLNDYARAFKNSSNATLSQALQDAVDSNGVVMDDEDRAEQVRLQEAFKQSPLAGLEQRLAGMGAPLPEVPDGAPNPNTNVAQTPAGTQTPQSQRSTQATATPDSKSAPPATSKPVTSKPAASKPASSKPLAQQRNQTAVSTLASVVLGSTNVLSVNTSTTTLPPQEDASAGGSAVSSSSSTSSTSSPSSSSSSSSSSSRRRNRRAEREAERTALERDRKVLGIENPLISMTLRGIDDSRYPEEVELQVVVQDSTGRFISGLAPETPVNAFRRYWRILADSALQTPVPIQNFRVQEISGSLKEPHAIAFVLDHSPSMGDARARRLQEAIRRTMNFVRPEDRVAVVKFTKDIKVEVPLTGDSAEYKNTFQIDGLEGYAGGTALYDGALAGISEVMKAPKSCKKTVILFSDGDDNSSKARIQAVYRAARANNVRIHTVAYGLTDETPMHNIASYSGGQLYRIYSTKEFPFVFADIYRSLKTYYRITYKPPQIAAVHTARITAKIPEFAGVRLSAEGSYDRSVVSIADTVGAVKFVNIEFETGKAVVSRASLPQLRDLARSLQSQPNITIEIRGHTDDRGSDELNQRLSEERANAVAQELSTLGIARKRLTTKGFGKSKPLVPNDSDENRQRNRRTEFVITGGVQ